MRKVFTLTVASLVLAMAFAPAGTDIVGRPAVRPPKEDPRL